MTSWWKRTRRRSSSSNSSTRASTRRSSPSGRSRRRFPPPARRPQAITRRPPTPRRQRRDGLQLCAKNPHVDRPGVRRVTFWHAVGAVVGLACLIYGGERAVEAAVTVAMAFGLPTLLVGGTLVAVGSSIPEITTAVYAGLYGAGDFVVSHIIGSITSQITLGVGIVALLSPLRLERGEVRFYGTGMILAMALMLAAISSGAVSRVQGGGLVAAYLCFLGVRLRGESHAALVERHAGGDRSLPQAAGWIVVGFALVAVGGHLLVVHSKALAVALGVPEYLLGLVTGLGTTAPEIAIAALAIDRGEADIAVGTLFGSNVTDPLFSLGAGALVGGIAVDRVGPTVASAGYTIAASVVVVGLFYLNGGIDRRAAVGCIAMYVPTFLL
ncbi:hypothetical protein DJ69_16970 [Halorubrum persicum]|uniref:Sodium/calcium exchanger membrane region domain-containing protein n=1 Tax=Halorubrum persicum TaxID=1383844 RepID=A0A2G1WEH2_9EURY|nr:hypothetical protein DJ69_16970 [Halorubrum persicum]